jgi:hypothetical protein
MQTIVERIARQENRRWGVALLVLALCGGVGQSPTAAAVGVTTEFEYADGVTREFVRSLRSHLGLTRIHAVALLGRNVREDEGLVEGQILLNGYGRYQVRWANVEEGAHGGDRRSGVVVHTWNAGVLTTKSELNVIQTREMRVRIEADFIRSSIFFMLRPPPRIPMRATLLPTQTFKKRTARPIRFARGEQELCVIYCDPTAVAVFGWTYMGETSAGAASTTVEVTASEIVDGVWVPVEQVKQIGEKFIEHTRYQRVWIGPAAVQRFNMP